MYKTSDIRKGLKIEMDNAPWTVVEFMFVKPGKGTAFTRTKLKNLITGSVIDRTWRTGDSLTPADVEEWDMQYLYNDGTSYYFMNTESFEQLEISAKVLGDTAKWLVDEMICPVLLYKNRPVTVELPNFVEMQIEYCEPAVRGNTAQGASKTAELTSGARIQVPLFVESKSWIKIDTRTGSYVERVRR